MDKLNKITVPASQKLRQLQKMVHDIKNNEGGIMDKIKKLKVKGPPSVPRRDYALDSPADEEEQWSDDFDSDYENPDEHSDSEMYVMPAEETGDDSYEPPPAEQQTRVVHPALPFARGEYVDNRSSQRHAPSFSKTLPSKPSWPSAKARLASTLPAPNSLQKPQVPPKPKDLLEDEADYVVPVEDNDENYIHPRESSPPPAEKAPMVNRSTKPNSSSKHVPLPGTVAGRNSGVWDSKSSLPTAPSPLPRAGKKAATPLKTTPAPPLPNASNVCEEKPVPAERHRGCSHRQDTVQSPVFPPTQKPVHQKPVPLPSTPLTAWTSEISQHLIPGAPGKSDHPLNCAAPLESAASTCPEATSVKLPPGFPEGGSPATDGPLPSFPANSTFADQEAELHGKPWYAGACDRKSAEEALYRSNKDGSFLIRKSSGHDSKQPYTLVAFFNKRVYNIPVRFIEATKQYALGKKKNGEEYFGSVIEIIKNHQHNPLVLIDSQNNTKDSTRLKYAVQVS